MTVRHRIDPQSPNLSSLFAAPFRVFFISAALWAVLALMLWLAALFTPWAMPAHFPGVLWHQHAMLVGLLNAAVAGFLLTAVGNWTQTRPIGGAGLAMLWGLWALGRVVVFVGGWLPGALVHGVDLLFLPLVSLIVARRVWAARQARQAVVVLAVAVLWLADVGLHLGFAGASGGALLGAFALMLVIGGRITPAFSRNWLRSHGRLREADAITDPRGLAAASIGLSFLLAAGFALGFPGPSGWLALAAALATALRLACWRPWLVRAEPLLWALPLALGWIPIAELLLAGHLLWRLQPATAWVHAGALGGMATLVLAVMCRVSLGHSGRSLTLTGLMVSALLALQAAAVVRVLIALQWMPWRGGILVAGLGWVYAFGAFLVCYTRMLSTARIDGRPG
ncbi:MAG: NnrS family protein [Pseudomonadota bacterium]|nr:NnrS family protein [Pseudomonadota bacterium]